MVPEKGAHSEPLDERLVEARDEVLLAGERIIAQEAADQGQAIVLTDSRIIILKVGITATGTLNGRKISVCPLGNITSISLRKGPMGAIIQVCGSETKLTPGERPPENIIVFSGNEKVKRCELMAQEIEKLMGKSIDRIEPKAEAPAVPAADGEAPAKPAPKKRAPRKKAEPAEEKTEPTAESMAAIVMEPVAEISAEVSSTDVVDQKTEPEPAKRRGGRVAKSLAEEMFGDMAAYTPPPPSAQPAQPEPPTADYNDLVDEISQIVEKIAEPVSASVSEPEPEEAKTVEVHVPAPAIEMVSQPEPVPECEPVAAVQQVIEQPSAAIEPEPEPETIIEEPKFRPNPNLPKPGRRTHRPSKALVTVGMLGLLTLMGVAIMGPLKQQQKPLPVVALDVEEVTTNKNLLRQQHKDITAYNEKISAAIERSDNSVSVVVSAVSSGNAESIKHAIGRDVTDDVLVEVNSITAPLGLAGAKENIASGLFSRKAAIESAGVSSADTLAKLKEADEKISKGAAAIQAMLADLDRRMSQSHK